MVDRKDIINHLYHKRELVKGFDFDGLAHPPISAYLTEEDIMRLNQLALSARLSAKPKEKYKAMDDIMGRRGFTRLHAGTNRLVYKSEYDDTIVMKVGIDKVGITDNPSEFYNQQALKPFCCKILDITPCGTVAMVERVEAVRNRQQFEEIAEDVFYTIVSKFHGFIMEDIGTNFFMNWGIRKGFGPVILDYPYTYKVDIQKLKCTHVDKYTGIECDGLIDYDIGFNTLVCEKCGTRYTARELGKHDHIVAIESALKNYKGGENLMEKFIVGTVINGQEYWFEDNGDRVIKPAERQKADKKFDNRNKKPLDEHPQKVKAEPVKPQKAKSDKKSLAERIQEARAESVKRQKAKANKKNGNQKSLDERLQEASEAGSVKPQLIQNYKGEVVRVEFKPKTAEDVDDNENENLREMAEESKKEVENPQVLVMAEANEPIEQAPKMVMTEVPDTPISAKARILRDKIIARISELEVDWLDENGKNYDESHCMTAINDYIEYMTPIIHSEFGIDAISAHILVTEVANDHFPDGIDSDQTTDEPESEGGSNDKTSSSDIREAEDDQSSNKQSPATDVVENARLAEF